MATAVLQCGDYTLRLKEDALEIVGPKARTCAPQDASCSLEGGTLVLKIASDVLRFSPSSAEEAQAWVSLHSRLATKDQPRVDRARTIVVKKKNKRQYLTLEDSVIKVYTHVDSSGNPPKDSAKKINLSTIRAIKIYGNTMLIDAFKPWELSVESPEEAQAWAQLVECAMEEWTRRELEDVQRRISAQSAIDEILAGGDSAAGASSNGFSLQRLPRQLDKDLEETLAVSRALKLSSVMHAGFMLKLGGLRKNVWERRYFVLHISGVLNYYEQPWDPAKSMEPSGILILPQLLAVEWGEVVSGCSCWPDGAGPEQRLKLVFDRKTYFLCCQTDDDCERWKDAIMDVANLFEDEDNEEAQDGPDADGFHLVSAADSAPGPAALTPAATLARAAAGSSSPNTLRRTQAAKKRRSLFLHTEFREESVVDDAAHEYAFASDRPGEHVSAAASSTDPVLVLQPAATPPAAPKAETAGPASAVSAANPAVTPAAAGVSSTAATAPGTVSSAAIASPPDSSGPAPAQAAPLKKSTLRSGKTVTPWSSSSTATKAATSEPPASTAAPVPKEVTTSSSSASTAAASTAPPTHDAAAAAQALAAPAGEPDKPLTTEQKAERERLQSELPPGGAVARARLGFIGATAAPKEAPARRPQVSLVEPEREVPSARPPPLKTDAAKSADGPASGPKSPGLGNAMARASRRRSIDRSPTKASPGRALGGKSVRRQPVQAELPSKVDSEAKLKPIENKLAAMSVKPATARSAAFVEFLEAPDLPQLLSAFETVLRACGLHGVEGNVYERLKTELTPSLNFKQKSLFQVIDKRRRTLLASNQSCINIDALVSGGGPIGLRTAIEMVLLEATVTVVERRERFSRFNILHLWDWVYADLISLGANGADLLGKSYFHIGTRDLQMLLARLAILAGVKFLVGYETADVLEPDESSEGLWRVTVRKLSDQSLLTVPANVFFVAGGANDAIAARLGFEPTVLGTSSAVGLVAHFTNTGSSAERSLDELSLARQYFPDIFGSLDAKGLCLENIVYYQGNTHYFVMTPKREALLAYGVIKKDLPAPQDLTRENIDADKLKAFARSAAEYFHLPPTCPFVTEGAPVQLFDFSTRKASKTSCAVRSDAQGNQLAVMLVGDAVLEPFWPEGLGINRGFHTAFDAIWVIQKFFASGHAEKPAALQAAREELFTIIKSLSAFTKGNIVVENTKGYGLNPGSRYKAWRG